MGSHGRRTRQERAPRSGDLRLAVLAGAALTGAASAAMAQSASGSASTFGKGPSSYESPINVSTRDANGNMVIVDGVMQGPQGSIFSNLAGMGASSATTGAGGATSTGSGAGGYGTATAVGNSLNVIVSGEYNTVIVNSSQTNTGAVTASTVLNGKVNLDGSQ